MNNSNFFDESKNLDHLVSYVSYLWFLKATDFFSWQMHMLVDILS